MQSSVTLEMTHSNSNNDIPKNPSLIQIQPNQLQTQKLIPVNIDSFGNGNNNKQQLYTIQGSSSSTNILPVQFNSGQFVRIQSPQNHIKHNILQLPNSSNATLISLPAQSINSQNLTFCAINPTQAANNETQTLLSNNKILFKTPAPINHQQGKSNFIKINPNPASLVGSISNGQSTPVICIDNNSPAQNYIKPTQPQQKIYILNSNQFKNNQLLSDKVIIQDNNTVSLPIQQEMETSSHPSAMMSMSDPLMQNASLEENNEQQTSIKADIQNISYPQQQSATNLQQNFILANVSPQKIEEKPKTVSGTLFLLNNFQKQQVLIPKANQTNQVFVPITLAGNLSLVHSQTDSIKQQTLQQCFIPIQSNQNTKPHVTEQPQQPSIFISGQGVQQEVGGGGSSFVLQPSSNNIPTSQSLKLNEKKSHKTTSVFKSAAKTKASTSSNSTSTTKQGKKPCNCTKSLCLKLYCECFANGEFCNNCNCRMCLNNIENQAERSKAVKACLERNPYAFHPKIGKGKIKGDTERRHTKGCNCKRSGCLKNYCECFEAKILCSTLCRCSGCKNFEESADQKTLMHLADAAEERVLQQNAAKTKLASEMTILESKPNLEAKEKLPSAFINRDVTKATCEILLARVHEAEAAGLSVKESEKLIFNEFSRCLNQIIDKSKQHKNTRRAKR